MAKISCDEMRYVSRRPKIDQKLMIQGRGLLEITVKDNVAGFTTTVQTQNRNGQSLLWFLRQAIWRGFGINSHIDACEWWVVSLDEVNGTMTVARR